MGKLCSLYLSQIAIKGVKKVPKLAERAVKIQKYFACVAFIEIKCYKFSESYAAEWASNPLANPWTLLPKNF